MRLLRNKKLETIYQHIATIAIWMKHGHIDDKDGQEMTIETLFKIAQTVGGTKGLARTVTIIREWEKKYDL